MKPGEFIFSAAHLDHGHIYGMTNGLLEAGGTLKYVYDPDPKKGYRAQYLALHTGDRYWTGEKVLAAPEIFRVLLAIEDGEAAGYIDLTHNLSLIHI